MQMQLGPSLAIVRNPKGERKTGIHVASASNNSPWTSSRVTAFTALPEPPKPLGSDLFFGDGSAPSTSASERASAIVLEAGGFHDQAIDQIPPEIDPAAQLYPRTSKRPSEFRIGVDRGAQPSRSAGKKARKRLQCQQGIVRRLQFSATNVGGSHLSKLHVASLISGKVF